MPRREISDFDCKEAWDEYVQSYWKAQSEIGERVEALDALTDEEKKILIDWFFFGEKPDKWPSILKGIIEGNVEEWICDLFNDAKTVSELDMESLAELFSFFMNEAPGNAWGTPASYVPGSHLHWRGMVG